ncbi:MAG: hypothetical protein ABEK17_04705 [Candidatus Aenigmatarchaeota archaeon]
MTSEKGFIFTPVRALIVSVALAIVIITFTQTFSAKVFGEDGIWNDISNSFVDMFKPFSSKSPPDIELPSENVPTKDEKEWKSFILKEKKGESIDNIAEYFEHCFSVAKVEWEVKGNQYFRENTNARVGNCVDFCSKVNFENKNFKNEIIDRIDEGKVNLVDSSLIHLRDPKENHVYNISYVIDLQDIVGPSKNIFVLIDGEEKVDSCDEWLESEG